jgi:diamine N-acetyltransferase
MHRQGNIELRPATAQNRAALEALRVSPAQLQFINTVADAFLEAEEEPDGRAIQFGLYDGETLVGFVMLSDEVGNPSYVAYFLWKLLIDERFQRHGYGTAAIVLVAEYFRSRGEDTMWTSASEATAARSRSTSAPGSSVRARPRGARSCSASICRCGSQVLRGIRLLRSA